MSTKRRKYRGVCEVGTLAEHEDDGSIWMFKGGEPADIANWEKISDGPGKPKPPTIRKALPGVVKVNGSPKTGI